MKHGIVIVALGYDIYGNCAYNLALSLKAYDSNIRVCLLYSESAIAHLKKDELELFDFRTELPMEEYLVNGKPQYQRSKLVVNKYTPFDFTMYMDADNIWVPEKKPSWLAGELMHKDFTIGMNGSYNPATNLKSKLNYTFWGDPEKICKYFNIRTILPQSVSGFYSFWKNDKTDKLFELARKVYDDPNAPTVTWANGKADEYCFNVAMGLLNMQQAEFHVFFFDKINGNLKPEEIYSGFWGIATGGHKVKEPIIQLYNRLVHKYSLRLGKMSRRYHVNKADVIPERKAF